MSRVAARWGDRRGQSRATREATSGDEATGRGLLVWVRSSRLGLVTIALLVGAAAGLGAAGFRWLIFGFTWLATGHQQFGQQGRVGSLHLPWLGIGFFVVIPIVGGLIYGPLIQRFAREARGHGVPEVMIAVAEDGGRIRPQVSVVKALASALCIGVGGSVGREGPIVQIGSALASSAGQAVSMSQTRLRILVACGAGGGIAATFNAPITGLFFGFELILRELSVDALFAVILSSVTADLVSRGFFGSAPFFTQVPHDLTLHGDYNYLLIALLGVIAGLIGVGFKTVLYRIEDLCDAAWHGRPEWARPAVGGVLLGLILLAVPQMYGVGYPVMDQAVGGHIVLWLLIILTVAKMVTASLTIGIGGSGGVFAPSLFTGAMAGTAFGIIVHHIFGGAVGSPAIYGVVAMGAVFAAAAQAPLTSIASVVEMTGNYTLALPIMLAVGIAVGLSKRLTYGTIYTTKLLRRGTDIERPRPASLLQVLTVADTMRQVPHGPAALAPSTAEADAPIASHDGQADHQWAHRLGNLIDVRDPQTLLEEETLEQALRQLVLYGADGLPVVSPDRRSVVGWITSQDVIQALARRMAAFSEEAVKANLAAEWAHDDPEAAIRTPPSPMVGYELIEIAVTDLSSLRDQRTTEVTWPPGSQPVAVTRRRRTLDPDTILRPGDHIIVVAPRPTARHEEGAEPSPPAGGVDSAKTHHRRPPPPGPDRAMGPPTSGSPLRRRRGRPDLMRATPSLLIRRGLVLSAAVAVVAGCGAAKHPTTSPTTAQPGASTSTSTSTTISAAPPSSSSPTSSPGTTSQPSTTSTPSTGTGGPNECGSGQLTASLGAPSGTAGTTYYQLQLRNTGSAPCFVVGYPGVSFVAGADGHQVGAPARRLNAATPRVVIGPGQQTSATLGVADAANFGSGCSRTQVAGLRVYPPDQRAALFVEHPFAACANAQDVTLTVRPFRGLTG